MQASLLHLPVAADWWTRHSTLIVGVAGIVVSGLVGPSVAAAWVSHRENRRDHFSLIDSRRIDLRAVIDDSAKLLGGAVPRVRQLVAAEEKGEPLPPGPADLLGELVPLGQRLQLRLPRDHEVVQFYEDACAGLRALAKERTSQERFEEAAKKFEAQREVFLNAGRKTLQGPISTKVEI
jgi:hypothetical protein